MRPENSQRRQTCCLFEMRSKFECLTISVLGLVVIIRDATERLPGLNSNPSSYPRLVSSGPSVFLAAAVFIIPSVSCSGNQLGTWLGLQCLCELATRNHPLPIFPRMLLAILFGFKVASFCSC